MLLYKSPTKKAVRIRKSKAQQETIGRGKGEENGSQDPKEMKKSCKGEIQGEVPVVSKRNL